MLSTTLFVPTTLFGNHGLVRILEGAVRVNREEKKKGEGELGQPYAALLKAQNKN